jgi:hypothetical protein
VAFANPRNEILVWNVDTGELVQDLSSMLNTQLEVASITTIRSRDRIEILVAFGDRIVGFRQLETSADSAVLKFKYNGEILKGNKGRVILMDWIAPNGTNGANGFNWLTVTDKNCKMYVFEDLKARTAYFCKGDSREFIRSAAVTFIDNKEKKIIGVEIMHADTNKTRILLFFYSSGADELIKLADYKRDSQALNGFLAVNYDDLFVPGTLLISLLFVKNSCAKFDS